MHSPGGKKPAGNLSAERAQRKTAWDEFAYCRDSLDMPGNAITFGAGAKGSGVADVLNGAQGDATGICRGYLRFFAHSGDVSQGLCQVHHGD
jgi:hypothetical protein